MAKKILVVDDNPQLRTLLLSYFKQEVFDVVAAGDGQEALFVARREKPDLILLDLMMPEMGGYEFLRIYSREANTPVIVLTARLEESDKVLGLELGADDYVTKPFSLRELSARVHAVLRRMEKGSAGPEILRAADISLDPTSRIVTVGIAGRGPDPIGVRPAGNPDGCPREGVLSPGAARSPAGGRLRRLRAHHRRPRAQPADQDRAGPVRPKVYRNGLRGRIPLQC